jgi:membrane-bound lytic murein transglycosylase B
MNVRAGFVWVFGFATSASVALASVERSPFPQPRVGRPAVALTASAPVISLMPRARPAAQPPRRDGAFDTWLADFRRRAQEQGIRASTLDRAFAGVTPDTRVLERETNQPEFSRPIWEYLESAVSQTRIDTGRRMLRDHAAVLEQIEARYNVDREVVVAVWGLESSYGRLRGTTRLIPALSALAMGSRRAGFYEEQLIGALRILQSGDVDPAHLVGSWAGAMGHTQFIPTSYLAYAVDFRGDGRRDIWSDDPTDSLASTAAYLAGHGWERGQPWGVEVRIPQGFNPRLANTRRDVAEWVALGLTPRGEARLPNRGEATLLFPAGSRGPAILAFQNFRTIKRYNNADSYAIAIGHLADRLRGAGPFQGTWPRDDRPLSRAEREELQRVLARAGLYDGAIDGRIGQGTLAAVRDWQAANGLAPDGYVSLALLTAMRR